MFDSFKGTWVTLVALALSTIAAANVQAGTVHMNTGGIHVTSTGGEVNAIGATNDGAVIHAGNFTVLLKGKQLTIGDKTMDLPADVDRVIARVNGWALEIDVNGKAFFRVSESDGIAVAGDNVEPATLNDLGVKYMTGDGVKRDPKRAIELYTKAAERGLALSQSNLAFVYWEGEHVSRDAKKAVEWAEKAADGGNGLAMWLLGSAYSEGDGVAKDTTKAIAWYTKAAETGDEASMNNLGVLYWNGDGVPKNLKTAVSWYRKAMDNGSIVAVSNLGEAYRDGEGVPQNLRLAELYLEAAANAGNKSATEALVALRRKQGKRSGLNTAAVEKRKYWFSENDVNIGPLTLSVLKIAIRAQRVKRDDMIWTPATKWQRARQIRDVNRLF